MLEILLHDRHDQIRGQTKQGLVCMIEDYERFLRLDAVIAKTGKSKASIYRDIRIGAFPSPIKIGVRTVAWRLSNILSWMESPANYQER